MLPHPPPFPAPYVLLDDARPEGAAPARLYRDPVEIVRARTAAEVVPALARVEALSQAGLHCAGYLAYEAGLALEPKLTARTGPRLGADGPLLWFGAFRDFATLPPAQVPAWLAAQTAAPATIGPLEPQLSPGAYARAFAAIHDAIHAGDIYQANLTLPLAGRYAGDPLALYAALRARAGAGYGAVLCDGSHMILSLSPELFFSLKAGEVLARPMKGTRPRGRDPAADAVQASELAAAPKDRAENLMIVDLMRNDLSRVAVPGSVRVEAPFAVESYPTVHQMVTTIRARLRPGLGGVDLLRALFPCGSITGAPKIRAMELIDATEPHPRGVYCGAIGRIDAGSDNATGDSAFNVAIRTLRLTPDSAGGGGRAVMGVGSAIVADSRMLPEWRECLVKGGFVRDSAAVTDAATPPVAGFDLVETMAFAPETGIALLDLHLARIGASARELGFEFDRHAVRNAIQALCFDAEQPARLRLTIARSGAYALELGAMPPALAQPAKCVVLPLPIDDGDWRLRHKTTDRAFYEAGLKVAHDAGAAEALFRRDDGLLTEGCFTNLFVPRDGILLTPPARLGLLPGVLRQSLLAAGTAREEELTLADCESGFFIGNALRGLIPAVLA
ncbi:MAG: aminodeoxychorismate synthase component I [Sphingomonadales bacterium]|nr:aminodeoxychorismate synthase component I [Sphingomonadales bacterium]